MKLKLSSFALVAMTFALMTTTAMAVPIPGLFTTGLDSFGIIVGIGVDDGNYTLFSGPITPNPDASVENPGWLANAPTSQWIGPPSPPFTPNIFAPAGTYVYELIFDLTGFDETTAQINGDWASDDSSVVRLNGLPAAGIPHTGVPPFNNIETFSFPIGSSFVPGINRLRFEVNNAGGPSGLHVLRLRGDATPIPEPSTALLALLGTAVFISHSSKMRNRKANR